MDYDEDYIRALEHGMPPDRRARASASTGWRCCSPTRRPSATSSSSRCSSRRRSEPMASSRSRRTSPSIAGPCVRRGALVALGVALVLTGVVLARSPSRVAPGGRPGGLGLGCVRVGQRSRGRRRTGAPSAAAPERRCVAAGARLLVAGRGSPGWSAGRSWRPGIRPDRAGRPVSAEPRGGATAVPAASPATGTSTGARWAPTAAASSLRRAGRSCSLQTAAGQRPSARRSGSSGASGRRFGVALVAGLAAWPSLGGFLGAARARRLSAPEATIGVLYLGLPVPIAAHGDAEPCRALQLALGHRLREVHLPRGPPRPAGAGYWLVFASLVLVLILGITTGFVADRQRPARSAHRLRAVRRPAARGGVPPAAAARHAGGADAGHHPAADHLRHPPRGGGGGGAHAHPRAGPGGSARGRRGAQRDSSCKSSRPPR